MIGIMIIFSVQSQAECETEHTQAGLVALETEDERKYLGTLLSREPRKAQNQSNCPTY